MNKKIKIIITVFIVSFIIFSAVEYSEIPHYNENTVPKDTVKKYACQTEIKCFNISAYSSNSSFMIFVDTAGFWKAGCIYGFIVNVAKISQNLSFPFTNSMFIVNNIAIKNENNTPVGCLHHRNAFPAYKKMAGYNYRICPLYNYMPPFNITLTIHGEYVLYSLIYHVQIDKTLTYTLNVSY